MIGATRKVSLDLMKTFIPLNALTSDRLNYLLKGVGIETLAVGEQLFAEGEKDGKTIYLLSGELDLISGAGDHVVVSAGDDASWFPIDAGQPRRHRALAKTRVNCMRIDSERLDTILSWDQSACNLVSEIAAAQGEQDQDWMMRLLGANIFYSVPAANIRDIFQRMRPVAVTQGQVIVRQNEPADACYFIKQGLAEVCVKEAEGERVLAILEPGQYFGEEGLLTEGPRNADVSMETDGVLMRLEKADFDELLKGPVVNRVNYEEACQLIRQGGVWLDVRLPDEYHTGAFNSAIQLPLQALRVKARLLDRSKHYITYCDTGRRSTAAAFLLCNAGYEVSVLAGGLNSLSRVDKERSLDVSS